MFAHYHSTIEWRGTSTACYRHLDYVVYTLHFHGDGLPHGKQAPTRHYTGLASDLDARLARHRAGNGSRLMSVVAERHVGWELAQLIPCESYSEAHELEARLKRHSATRRCPVCQGKPVDPLVGLRQGHWPLRIHSQVGPRRAMPRWQNVPMRGGDA